MDFQFTDIVAFYFIVLHWAVSPSVIHSMLHSNNTVFFDWFNAFFVSFNGCCNSFNGRFIPINGYFIAIYGSAIAQVWSKIWSKI